MIKMQICYFFSLVCLSLAHSRRWKSVIGSFLFWEKKREREEVNGGQVARFSNFHIFSLTCWLNVEKMRQWLDLTMWDQSKHPTQNLGMKAWWIELSQHLFFCQTAGSWEEHFYICRFSLLILASLCNNTLTQLPKASNNYLQK